MLTVVQQLFEIINIASICLPLISFSLKQLRCPTVELLCDVTCKVNQSVHAISSGMFEIQLQLSLDLACLPEV